MKVIFFLITIDIMEDLIRLAAFNWLRTQREIHGDILSRKTLENGFEFQGERITLVGPSGIWKPRQFQIKPLSITTTYNSKYEDKVASDVFFTYKYRGSDTTHRDNVGLKLVMETKTPLIYFVGLLPDRYVANFPAFIVQDNPTKSGVYCRF